MTRRRAALLAGGVVAAALLPFILLVRGAVVLYGRGWPAWLATLAGVALAAAALGVAGWLMTRRLPHPPGWRALFLVLALPATLGFAGQGLLSLASVHAKTAAERADWRRTHPLLRLAVAVIAVADRDLVITDLRRSLDDYDAWGLERLGTSRHLPQVDGYAHAMDLRTAGRGRLRNWSLALYFRAMGFHTVRHVGTADHLHVELR